MGRLLRVLAGRRRRIAEAGTGCGVGTARLADGMASDAALVTVETDPGLAEATRRLLAGDERVAVVLGDWRAELPSRGPFDLLFLDGGGWKRSIESDCPLALQLLAPAASSSSTI